MSSGAPAEDARDAGADNEELGLAVGHEDQVLRGLDQPLVQPLGLLACRDIDDDGDAGRLTIEVDVATVGFDLQDAAVLAAIVPFIGLEA